MGRSICQVQLAVPKAKPNSKAKTGFPPGKLMDDERGEGSSWLSLHPPFLAFKHVHKGHRKQHCSRVGEHDRDGQQGSWKNPVPTGRRFFQKMKKFQGYFSLRLSITSSSNFIWCNAVGRSYQQNDLGQAPTFQDFTCLKARKQMPRWTVYGQGRKVSSAKPPKCSKDAVSRNVSCARARLLRAYGSKTRSLDVENLHHHWWRSWLWTSKLAQNYLDDQLDLTGRIKELFSQTNTNPNLGRILGNTNLA